MGLEILQTQQRLGGSSKFVAQYTLAQHSTLWIKLQLKTEKVHMPAQTGQASQDNDMTSARGGLATRASLAMYMTKLRRPRVSHRPEADWHRERHSLCISPSSAGQEMHTNQRRIGIAGITRYDAARARQVLGSRRRDYFFIITEITPGSTCNNDHVQLATHTVQ